jgi:flagellar biosynthesis protein FlhB
MPDNKTEEPTPKKLREARRKGQVAKSNDLTQACLFLTAVSVLSLAGGWLMDQFRALLIQSFDPQQIAGVGASSRLSETTGVFARFLSLSGPLLGALFLVSLAVSFLQVGGIIFSTEAVSLKFERLNPFQGFHTKFFNSRTYLELAKNLIKFPTVLWLTYITIRAGLRDVVLAARLGIPQAAGLASGVLFGLLFKVGAVFLVIGAADLLLQRKLYIKELKMTKEEVKREYREDEGDPHIKHRRKHLHQQLLTESMMNRVPTGKAVVVNPTHLAIALDYEEITMPAPQIAAKGQMLLAQKIIEIAKQHRIPIVRNVSLAHKLFALEVDEEIPEELYEAVAEILNWVYQLAKREEA